MNDQIPLTQPERATERAFRGTLLHTPARGQLEMLHDALLIAGANGSIEAVHRAGTADHAAAVARFAERGQLLALGPGQYLLPGMVDLHVHAPQWPQLGKALDLPLREWLQKYTFPLEARYADVKFAETVYESLVDGLLANGTTCALYYGTIHLPATRRLAEICLRRGQRALIGRVAMDHPGQCPDYYRDSSAQVAIEETRQFIEQVRALPGNGAGAHGVPLIWPVITPRFIPSCTDELLHGLGALAQEAHCHIQTHCSESDWEHRYVFDRCGVSDTRALERYGLLSRHTILAHGNFVEDDDVAALVQHGAGVAHCPLSNVYFSDGVLPLRHLLERGVRAGLGTDISGGASPSVIENARHAILASRNLESGVDPAIARSQRRREGSRIEAPTALWLATAGGGIALDLPIGIFKTGYQFDAIVLDGTVSNSNLRVDPGEPADVIAQKIIHHAARANVREVWVGNRRVRQLDPTG
jgi:guanine deaminase